MRRWRDKRIGVDLDACSEFQLLKTVLNAKNVSKNVDVKRTGHGFHIRIFKKHNLKQNFEVRRNLGDDPIRLLIDEQRLAVGLTDSIDTLFNGKRVKGVITREEPHNTFALPFWSRRPARKN